jgi:HEAT repeat protein
MTCHAVETTPTPRRPRYFRLLLTLLAPAVLLGSCLSARQSAAETAAGLDESELIAVVLGDGPKADKAIACKKLAVCGTAEAVPALATLLTDEELISWARIGLEAIPGPESAAALRDALTRVKGRSLVGVINSLGVKQDVAAVESLIPLLGSDDEQVAAAAAVALGKIGGAASATALQKALPKGTDDVRSAVAEGLVYAAEGLLAADDAKQAVTIYDQVRAADVPTIRKLEATRGAILARGDDGISLLLEQLRSDDKPFFYIGLTTARELTGQAVTDAIAAEVTTAPPAKAALLLKVLEDRGDKITSAVVMDAATKGEPAVRAAAIGVLGKLGDASAVPALLAAAADADAAVAETAQTALAELSAEGVEEKLLSLLTSAEGDEQVALMKVIGKRRLDAADALFKMAASSDSAARAAAIKALGETVNAEELAALIELVKKSSAGERDTALAALKSACVRMGDRDAAAGKVISAMSGESIELQCAMLEILGAMEGDVALAAIGNAGKTDNEQLQDAATQVLGRWMTADAAPTLLSVAKEAPGEKYRLRALRGYLRVARQLQMSDAARGAVCMEALKLIDRDDERKLILEIVDRHPSIATLRAAAEVAKSPALRKDAIETIQTGALKLTGSPAAARELLGMMGDGPMQIEIVSAKYGADGKMKDVTGALQAATGDIPLIVLSEPYNTVFGGDPAPGTVKTLTVEYKINGKSGSATFSENAKIMLPKP